MKYISTILLLFAMHWSWGLAKNGDEISQQVHLGIQEDLKKLISEYIQQNLPNSTDLRFERFWTEAVHTNQVKASFIYSFREANESSGKTRVQIEGFAVLNRVQETADSIEWTFDKLQILNNTVTFEDGMSIRSPKESEEEANPTTEEDPAPVESTKENHE